MSEILEEDACGIIGSNKVLVEQRRQLKTWPRVRMARGKAANLRRATAFLSQT